ncbi:MULTISPECIES: neutral zinc metallopeptidase [unclassified Streptomyces]|uniref:Neutral zinc metallopeptidase n=1 Tax=Streptomyces sp. NBC_00060 TaxID=2975636 RepID=A0AAU2H5H4_9ACTN
MFAILAATVLGAGGLAGTANADVEPPADEASVTAYIKKTIEDSAYPYWGNWLKSHNLQQAEPLYKIIQRGETYQDACDGTISSSDVPSAFYCPQDVRQDGVLYEGVLVFPVETMLAMQLGEVHGQYSEKAGEFTVATTVTHEMGHWVQDVLVYQKAEPPLKPGKHTELMADCFSGVWAAAKGEGALTVADFEAAVESRKKAGDTNFTEPDHHGTPQERANAWKIGFFGLSNSPGSYPENCIDEYWRS